MAVGPGAVEGVVMPGSDFWRGRRVLLTGHTGFKGGWLTLWLQRLGAEVTGVALPPPTQPNLFALARIDQACRSKFCDIRDAGAVAEIVRAERPEIVFHLAAQPLVRASYADPLATFSTNTLGTANVLDALRGRESVRVAIVVTTDKVYSNREWPYPYRESDALGGHDPYSASKAAAEIVAASYRDAFLTAQGVALATARAGNVIGGGDWAEDRLIPDAVRAWESGGPLIVRRPHAIRPWQHVLEPLAGYLVLAERLWAEPALAGAWNFGPDTAEAMSVGELIELARSAYGSGRVELEGTETGPHEAWRLSLEIAKARALLGVAPRWRLAAAVGRTMDWYRRRAAGEAARTLCEADIAAYEEGE